MSIGTCAPLGVRGGLFLGWVMPLEYGCLAIAAAMIAFAPDRTTGGGVGARSPIFVTSPDLRPVSPATFFSLWSQ
jgi:hypothetical protein